MESPNRFTNDDDDIQLDHPLQRLQESVAEVAEKYTERTQMMEANVVQQRTINLLLRLSKALLDPYMIILLAYLSIVLILLVLLTRSALLGKFGNIKNTPNRIKILLISAGFSLATTWFKMIAYLFWSYNAFLSRAQLTGEVLATIPICSPTLSEIDCFLAKGIVTSLRMQHWLQSTSLFQESWLYVVGEKHNWWWSIEVCLFTVGVWACYLRVQGDRMQVQYVWAYMILGQICAISVAQGLFSLAIAMQSLSDSAKDVRLPLDANLLSNRFVRAGKKTKLSSKPIQASPHPLIRLLIILLTLSGLLTVYIIPSGLRSILVMHILPITLVLPFTFSTSLIPAWIERHVRLSYVYTILAILSAGIRIESHIKIFGDGFVNGLQRVLQAALDHPAQSSISADALCIALNTFLDVHHQRSMGFLTNTQAFVLSTMIPIIGPSSTFALSVAIREKEVECLEENYVISSSKSKNSGTIIPRKEKVKSKSQSDDESGGKPLKSIRRRSSSKSVKTPSRDSTIRRRRSQSHIGLNASDEEQKDPSTLVDSPATRAKRTPARPRKKDLMDGEALTAEKIMTTPLPKRTTKRTSSSRSRSER